jgi:WD40 repeat protein
MESAESNSRNISFCFGLSAYFFIHHVCLYTLTYMKVLSPTEENAIVQLTFDGPRRLVAATNSGNVLLVDYSNGAILAHLPPHDMGARISSLSVIQPPSPLFLNSNASSMDSLLATCGADGRVRI